MEALIPTQEAFLTHAGGPATEIRSPWLANDVAGVYRKLLGRCRGSLVDIGGHLAYVGGPMAYIAGVLGPGQCRTPSGRNRRPSGLYTK